MGGELCRLGISVWDFMFGFRIRRVGLDGWH